MRGWDYMLQSGLATRLGGPRRGLRLGAYASRAVYVENSYATEVP